MSGIMLPPPHLYGLHRRRGENIKNTKRRGSATLGQTRSELFSQTGNLREKYRCTERCSEPLMLWSQNRKLPLFPTSSWHQKVTELMKKVHQCHMMCHIPLSHYISPGVPGKSNVIITTRRVVRVQQKAMKTNGKRRSSIWFCICLVFLRLAVDVYVN